MKKALSTSPLRFGIVPQITLKTLKLKHLKITSKNIKLKILLKASHSYFWRSLSILKASIFLFIKITFFFLLAIKNKLINHQNSWIEITSVLMNYNINCSNNFRKRILLPWTFVSPFFLQKYLWNKTNLYIIWT